MEDINHPILKLTTATTAFVSLTWIDWLTTAGQIAAALTALAIFGELVWKKVLRPLMRELAALKAPFKDTE